MVGTFAVAMQRYLVRATTAIFGRPPVASAARVHALHSFANACFTVSLAGSLLLSVSFDAARPRIIAYLIFTMAPFAIVAPLLGPLVDRLPGGHRAMIGATVLLRAVICFALGANLRGLMVFPLAFAMLVLDKTYSVTRHALVPRLVGEHELVPVNSRLARLGTLSSGAGGACAAVLFVNTSGRWVSVLGGIAFLVATVAAAQIPRSTAAPVAPDSDIAWHELHGRPIVAAQSTMLAMKAATGFLLFLLGVGLKRTGAPTWFFGIAFVAHGAGSFGGNSIAPALRRRFREPQMLAGSLAATAVVTTVAAIASNRIGTALAAFGIGAGAAIAHQAFNATLQQNAPDVDRGRMFAAFDTRFQLAWVLGALVAVIARPDFRIGFAALTVLFLLADSQQALQRARRFAAGRPEQSALAELGLSARRMCELGEYRSAAVLVLAGMELLEKSDNPPSPEVRDHIERLRSLAADRTSRIGPSDLEPGLRAVGWIPGA
jgi:MFS family permease